MGVVLDPAPVAKSTISLPSWFGSRGRLGRFGAMIAVWALAPDRQVRHDFKLRHWIEPGCRAQLTLPRDRQRFAAWSLAPADAPLLDRVPINPDEMSDIVDVLEAREARPHVKI
jgi:hypothetical protein